VKIFLEQNIR